MNDFIRKFKEDGYINPVKILDEKECKKLLNEQYIPKRKYTWSKSIHEKSLEIVNLAKNKKIIEIIENLLGKNIILWSSCFIKQNPGQQHSWHIDLEYRNWNGVTVWLGLKNLNEQTNLSLVKSSQQLNTFPQKLNNEGVNIDDDKEILKNAKNLNQNCEIETFNLDLGEMIVWEGKMWHKTINNSNKSREAIILQYSTTDEEIKIPINYNSLNLEWLEKRPPCIIVSGEDEYNKNLIIDISNLNPIGKIVKFFYKIKFFIAKLFRKIL